MISNRLERPIPMRCTRCDRIVGKTRIALDREDRLVFGWCDACLSATGCTVQEGPSARIQGYGAALRHRLRRFLIAWRRAGGWRGSSSRRLVQLGFCGMLGGWALILATLGAWRLDSPAGDATGFWGTGLTLLLLVGAGGMAMLSLALWTALLPSPRRGELRRRFARFTIGLIACLALVSPLVWLNGGRLGSVFSSAIFGYLVSWLLIPRLRRARPSRPSTPAALLPSRPRWPSSP